LKQRSTLGAIIPLHVLLAQAMTKLELMDSNNYVAKIVQAKSKCKPPADSLKDPKSIALKSAFEDLICKYQMNSTAIIHQLVNHQATVYHKNILLLLVGPGDIYDE
jgi:hypothetical protein